MKEYLNKGAFWEGLNDQTRIACYNGMGAEWMSETSREILDFLFSVLDDAVRIHDVDYCYATKTQYFWHKANENMRDNMILLAKREIPWYRWFKYRRFVKVWIPILFKCVESSGGWSAFKTAHPPTIH